MSLSRVTRQGSFFVSKIAFGALSFSASENNKDVTMTSYEPMKAYAKAFLCPHCGVYAGQDWRYASVHKQGDLPFSNCLHCQGVTIWFAFDDNYASHMIYPDASGIAPPNSDLRDDIRDDYEEAASIVHKSPRGATALMRLCIQKVCEQLGEKGKKIDDDIAALVKRGLPITVQQALDIVRVVGNNAVHPGQIDLKDDQDTAMSLFGLVNLIAQIMITQPQEVAALYGSLPPTSLDAIQRRDAIAAPPTSESSNP